MRRINERALVGMIVLGLVLSAVASLCGTSDTTTFTKYNTATPICLILNDTVANSGNGSYQYMTFYPEIDAYTLIHAQGSFELFHPYSTGDTSIQKLEILLEAGGQISPATGWFKFNYTVPFFTAIINLSNGKVNSISWQSGCFSEIVGDSCTLCLNDGRDCGVSNSTCGVSNTGNINVTSTTCDAKVYVAFSGTDSKGNYMTSSGKTLSNFRSYSALSLYNNIINIPTQVILAN